MLDFLEVRNQSLIFFLSVKMISSQQNDTLTKQQNNCGTEKENEISHEKNVKITFPMNSRFPKSTFRTSKGRDREDSKLLVENSETIEKYQVSHENVYNLNATANSSEDGDEKLFIEETQNLMTSLSGISKSYSQDEEKENEDEDSGLTYENQYDLDCVCGLADIKETLLNIFIYPAIFPHFFPRRIRWNQILLYGPPGTGKTMLARGIATEINANLQRVTGSDLLSHWQGQTEKKIRHLFEEARSSSEPTILFFDEIDGLCRRRTNSEDDNTRRVKTELLTQLDDFTRETENHQTYIIGATNCPWEIDSSFMRRFHKKIFIPLPDKGARLDILKKNFDSVETDLTDSEWNEVAETTEGYSGSDLVNIVMTSCCERFAQVKRAKYWEAKGDFWIPAGSCSLFSTRMNFQDIHPDKIGVRSIIFTDIQTAIANTPKTVGGEELFKYLEFSTKIK